MTATTATTAVGRGCQAAMICQLIMGGHHYIPAHHLWAPEHYADTPAHRPAVPDMMAHQKNQKVSIFIWHSNYTNRILVTSILVKIQFFF